MKDEKTLIKEILEIPYLMSLATVDESGPWVSDVVFVYDDSFNIYWLSMESYRHSKAILNNKKVAASITVSNNQGEPNIGLQLEGEAFKIEGDLPDLAIKHLHKRKKSVDNYTEGSVFKPGQSWYKLVPSKFDIIYEPYWGHQKKIFTF